VWDVLPAVVDKTHYELPRRRCGCGTTTTAQPPFGRAGTVSYGPNLNAAAVLLGSAGNVPVERTAMLIGALLGVEVSTGFSAVNPHMSFFGTPDMAMTASRAEYP